MWNIKRFVCWKKRMFSEVNFWFKGRERKRVRGKPSLICSKTLIISFKQRGLVCNFVWVFNISIKCLSKILNADITIGDTILSQWEPNPVRSHRKVLLVRPDSRHVGFRSRFGRRSQAGVVLVENLRPPRHYEALRMVPVVLMQEIWHLRWVYELCFVVPTSPE